MLAFGTAFLGGEADDTNKVYIFDTTTNKITQQSVSGTAPQPRILATGTLGKLLLSDYMNLD